MAVIFEFGAHSYQRTAMLPDTLLLDVLSCFRTARDAVNFITASGLRPELVPTWDKEPVERLVTVAVTPFMRVLREKGYCVDCVIFTFGAHPRVSEINSVKAARDWIMRIASENKFNKYWDSSIKTLRYRWQKPLMDIIAKKYHTDDTRTLTCYGTGGKYFIHGQHGWEPIEFRALVEALSRELADILSAAHDRALLYLGGQLTVSMHVGVDLNPHVQHMTKELSAASRYLRQVARFGHADSIAEEIKKMLSQNWKWLAAFGVFD